MAVGRLGSVQLGRDGGFGGSMAGGLERGLSDVGSGCNLVDSWGMAFWAWGLLGWRSWLR